MTRSDDTFGERLRAARNTAGLTQSQVVDRSGIPKPTLSRYENDHVLPSLQTLGRLADALGVPESVLLPRKRSPEEELYVALTERGVNIRSRAEARRIADIVVDALEPGVAADAKRRRSS